jgi:DNA-binding transcriptional regulator WhiA
MCCLNVQNWEAKCPQKAFVGAGSIPRYGKRNYRLEISCPLWFIATFAVLR